MPYNSNLQICGTPIWIDGVLYNIKESICVGDCCDRELVLKIEKPELSIVNCCASCMHINRKHPQSVSGKCPKRKQWVFYYNWCPEYKRRDL